MKIIFVTGLCFLIVYLSMATTTAFAQNFSELESVALAEMKEKSAVGAAVAIVQDGKIVYSKGFGSANIETGALVTSQTLFQTGSIAKCFTAALILKLADQGKLKIDAPVGDYVRGVSPKLSRVTLAQLLSQTAGLIDEPDEFGAGDETLMASYLRSWQDDYVLFDPGEVFSYSNPGYALAGLTAQEVMQKPYLNLMDEEVFQPLKMTKTTFRPTVAMTYQLAVGHTIKPGETPKVVRPLAQDARLYPAGTMYSNVDETARFAMALLNGGRLDGGQVIPIDVVKEMLAPHASLPSASDDSAYGYGMFMNTDRGIRQIWHDGSMTGYVAQLKLLPELKAAIIILGNTNNVVLAKTQEKALELLTTLSPPTVSPAKTALAMSAAEMSRYLGTYLQPNRWKIEIFINDNNLYIRELGQELPLAKIGENRFSFQFPNAVRPLEIYIKPADQSSRGYVHQYVWAFAKI